MKIQITHLSVLCGGLALSAALAPSAQAQRDTQERRQEQRGQRQERRENLTPEQRAQERQQRMQQWQQRMNNMTPEQRAAMQQRFQQMQAQREAQQEQAKWAWVRTTLVASGYTDKTMQDVIIAFMQAQEKARQPLRATALKLTEGLVNPETAGEKFTTDLAAFRSVIEQDNERYKTELAALDAQIKYSTQPRLEMLLTVLGVVGAEVPVLGGIPAVFPDSPFGGGGRGGRGGPGGAGGGRGGAGGGMGGPGGPGGG